MAELRGTTSAPVNAHPLLPLPPVPAPGTPDPLYCVEQVNHPSSVLVGPGYPGVGDENPPVSMGVPGAAMKRPAIPVVVVSLISKLAMVALRNAKVKYCSPLRPVARSGPDGKYPELKLVTKCLTTPYRSTASCVPAIVCTPLHTLAV